LGTSTSKEAKEYFEDMARHRIKFKYGGNQDDNSIAMVCSFCSYFEVPCGYKIHFAQAFSKKCIDQRKEWLTNWMEECKRRREMDLPEVYLYEKDTKAINFADFVNKELVLFSNADNERSIPSVMDGLKPGQRKVFG
jgi:DNA topoisomerase II